MKIESLALSICFVHLNQRNGEIENVDPEIISRGRANDFPILILKTAIVDKFPFATMIGNLLIAGELFSKLR